MKTIPKNSARPTILLLAALSLAMLVPACDRLEGERRPENAKPDSAKPAAAVRGEEPAAETVSDLDQPLEKLMTATCEHNILQYTCDECRYQVGAVKASPDLFDPAKGGILETMTVSARPLLSGKDLNGEVRLNEEKAVYVSPRAPGVVRSILVDLGSHVEQGRVLFEVESAELRQAKAEYLRSEASLALAEATAVREKDLFDKKICPRKDWLEAEAALKQAEADTNAAEGSLESFGLSPGEVENLSAPSPKPRSGLMPVRAPFAGTVLERALSLGAHVQPGDRLILIADTSAAWVLTTLYEREVAAVLEAQLRGRVRAEVAVTAYPGRIFEGYIDRIGGTLDEATRTTKARVVVENPDNLLRAGMFARVRLKLSDGDGTIAVPEEAVIEDAGRTFVFVRVTPPYFVRRPVTKGRVTDGWVEITSGIKEGDVIVVKGAFLLKSDVLRSKMGAGCAD